MPESSSSSSCDYESIEEDDYMPLVGSAVLDMLYHKVYWLSAPAFVTHEVVFTLHEFAVLARYYFTKIGEDKLARLLLQGIQSIIIDGAEEDPFFLTTTRFVANPYFNYLTKIFLGSLLENEI